jgi:mRNA-degrading endonuclease RelE of RelBE toxin-antitoxin system
VKLKNHYSFYRIKSESYRMIDETNNKLIILVAKVGCRTNITRKNI